MGYVTHVLHSINVNRPEYKLLDISYDKYIYIYLNKSEKSQSIQKHVGLTFVNWHILLLVFIPGPPVERIGPFSVENISQIEMIFVLPANRWIGQIGPWDLSLIHI